jgi:acyl transferase domain-containing protein
MQNVVYSWIKACETHITYSSDMFLLSELIEPRDAEHLRKREFSQPLVTALQIALVDTLKRWGISAKEVVGHSSGEIAAAYAAGLLSKKAAIIAAYYRGQAAPLSSRVILSWLLVKMNIKRLSV